MSISYNAQLVCGFEVEVEPISVTKTKYNQDTGEPYTTKVAEHDALLVDGTEVANTKDDVDVIHKKFEGLQFGCSGYEDNGQRWLGFVVGEVDDYSSFALAPMETPQVVKDFADKYSLTPKWLLIQSCG